MRPVLAAASGGEAVAELEAALRAERAAGEAGPLRWVRHVDALVAWEPACRWIDVHDDGQLLVVVDGRLHGAARGNGPAARVAERYRPGDPWATARDLIGDHVVVVLDRGRGRLVVGRDPLGVRPWYQSGRGDRWVGATTEGFVARRPWVDDEVDERTAVEHLASVWVSSGRTYHRGVRTLAPGTTAVVERGRAAERAHHRWQLRAELDTTWDEAVERCRTLLDVAVADRLPTSVPATSQLSGGLDSSAVVGTVVGLGAPDLVGARLVFTGPTADERSWSDEVARHWGVPLVTAEPWVPSGAEADELTRRLGRPVPDPHFTMFAGLHRALLPLGRPEGLTGLGGDDAFATSGPGTLLVSALRLGRVGLTRQLVGRAGPRPADLWRGLVRPALFHLARWKGRALPPWVDPAVAARTGLTATLRRRPARTTGLAAVDERIDNLTSGYDALVLETQAVVSDLEGRRDSHPFLDPRLVAGTYGLDPFWPGRDGHQRALQVAAYADRLPPAVAARRDKAEFSEIFWPALLHHATTAQVRSGPLVEAGWLRPEGFDDLVRRAQRGMADAAIPLARCVSLDRWLRLR